MNSGGLRRTNRQVSVVCGVLKRTIVYEPPVHGLQRDEVEHVMESFDALRRREERQLGEFRTKRLILDRYDAMADARATGNAYQTILDPPPGHGPRHAAGRGTS